MQKKSQVQQIFIYIIAIILFSLLLVYGYKAIKDFRFRTGEVMLLQLKNDISSSVKKVSSDYGTIIKKELDVPFKYKEACFVDLKEAGRAESTDICNLGNVEYNPIVCDSWSGEANDNMFLISPEDTKTDNIGEIRIEDYFFCTKVVNGRVILRLEGKGDYVLLSEWQG